MIVAHNADELTPHLRQGAVLAWGNFDGVHLGHQALLRELRERADALGLPAVVVTFDPHPLVYFKKDQAPKAIADSEDRLALLAMHGVDYTLMQRFDSDFAAQSPEEFVGRLLRQKLNAKAIVLGYDTAFGKGREGGFEFLKTLEAAYGFEITRIQPTLIDGDIVASTRIRRLIQAGELEKIPQLLGRVHSIHGPVTHGADRGGKLLGIPTANLDPGPLLLPPQGVYACLARLENNFYIAPTSLGTNPSFGGGAVTLEAHLLDFDQDLYERDLRLYFLEYLRPERKFSDPESLRDQIRLDQDAAVRVAEREKARPGFSTFYPL